MAGSQDQDENPVAINVVPMVDVIFCLCVFFMCSFKFKQLEGKFDSWLPRDLGPVPGAELPLEEIRVALFWDPARERVVRQLGARRIVDDAELGTMLHDARADWERAGRTAIPVTIDAAGPVPWREVIDVMNLCKRERIDRIEFAYGTGLPPDPGGGPGGIIK
jgi:biopolymer transport protein ExbD